MTIAPHSEAEPEAERSPPAFFALALSIAWTVFAARLALPAAFLATFGELGLPNPLFYLVVCAPAVASRPTL